MDDGVRIVGQDGHRRALEAETVVLAVGLRSNNGLYADLSEKRTEVYSIGDCREPRKVINAIWEGFRIARLI